MAKVKLSRDGRARSKSGSESGKYFSKAIGKAFEILDILKRSPEPLALNQLTLKTGLAKSSVFRILHTLERLGFLQKIGGDLYVLSSAVASLVPNQMLTRLIATATPLMKELGREFRESISLAFLFQNHIEVVMVIESPQRMQMGNILGSIIPPHASSLGKSIAACQPEWRRETLLRTYGICAFTPHTITDEVELNKELDLVRERRYATDLEESTLEGCCFGAPIFGDDQHAIAALSISMPKGRVESQEKIISAVRSVAAVVSNQLKSRP